MLLSLLLALAAPSLAAAPSAQPAGEWRADIVVYGCTSAGVTAAIAGRQMGRSVVLVCPDDDVGGMTTNGLGLSDSGDHRVIGGLSLQFYRRVKAYYDRPSAWRGGHRPNDATEFAADGAQWRFEPHVAEAVYEDWLRETGVTVVRNARLDRGEGGVERRGARIEGFRSEDGRRFGARVVIDATYEGDLMAAAGVSFTVGREANAQYGETLDGVELAKTTHHQFEYDIDPYQVPGHPESGLLPYISADKPGPDGSGDAKVQAYMYRLCLTDVADNQTPLPRPEGYDPADYELLARYLAAGFDEVFGLFGRLPNGKVDVNNWGAFSFDAIGLNYAYPTASYVERARILAKHRRYQQGLLWFLGHDPRVPPKIRAEMGRWGLCRDEFTHNGHWPREIYVREGRRMVSDFVMAEPHLTGTKPTPDPIGMGSYAMDSHNVQRIVDARGFVRNEGNIEVHPDQPYPISYRAIAPKAAQADNLLVPVALSASHIAYGSIRMEPVFMILGESAGVAAALAIDEGKAVQAVDYPELRKVLLRRGQILRLKARRRSGDADDRE
ncbi:FAD-dependent oxidoreductase [Sphingomonas sp. PR090111-T3T-6A]|uniref:FAD-dependent oxidoreductase n=1 Tax=Sphingomonas sp. PR090111-T3T-6A TaxID=685778 RepID=UPI0003A693A4|nr:FAD-dependent oxidoreductase [Sphingomonas sp. PR090111-T3T-6A]